MNSDKKLSTAVIISSSVRTSRLSHRVSLCLQTLLKNHYENVEMLDLKAFDFPLLEERFAFLQDHNTIEFKKLSTFREAIEKADSIYMVSPVYNASFPAALKNIIDAFYTEWQHKKIGVCSVSSGNVPGIATLGQLQSLMLKMGSYVAPVLCTITEVESQFDEKGNTAENSISFKNLQQLIAETKLL